MSRWPCMESMTVSLISTGVRTCRCHDFLLYFFIDILLHFFIDISKAISRKWCKIAGKLILITDRKSYMSFWFIPKSVTLNDEMALFCVTIPNLVVFQGALRKSGWQSHNYGQFTITIYDYCLVVNICRGIARRQGYKFLADS